MIASVVVYGRDKYGRLLDYTLLANNTPQNIAYDSSRL